MVCIQCHTVLYAQQHSKFYDLTSRGHKRPYEFSNLCEVPDQDYIVQKICTIQNCVNRNRNRNRDNDNNHTGTRCALHKQSAASKPAYNLIHKHQTASLAGGKDWKAEKLPFLHWTALCPSPPCLSRLPLSSGATGLQHWARSSSGQPAVQLPERLVSVLVTAAGILAQFPTPWIWAVAAALEQSWHPADQTSILKEIQEPGVFGDRMNRALLLIKEQFIASCRLCNPWDC